MGTDSAVLPPPPAVMPPTAAPVSPVPEATVSQPVVPLQAVAVPVALPVPTAPRLAAPSAPAAAAKPKVVITRAPRLGQRKLDWKSLGLTVAFSAGMHAIALVACMFIVFKNPGLLEDIFTQITEEKEEVADDPIIEQSLVQPEDIKETSQDNVVASESTSEMLFEKGPVDLNVNDLAPAQVKVEAGDLSGLPDIKFDNAASGRMSATAKAAMVRHFGGNSASEAAVASGMKWLANHQYPDGSWSLNHSAHPNCKGQCSQAGKSGEKPFESRMAATGLALLVFLGGGHTHQSGDYQKDVKSGVEFLLKNGRTTSQGFDLCPTVVANEKMYTQGICTIALSELAALTKDPRVRSAASSSVEFIVKAQNTKWGGWVYNPSTTAGPMPEGDTSVTGWQIMALKSAQNAKLKFPPQSFTGCSVYLDSVQTNGGAQYKYGPPQSGPTASMTAAALLCRMYLGWDRKNKGLQDGVIYLGKVKPSPNDMYYNYYATQVMHHWGGEEWTAWNNVMRDQLVRTQHTLKDGHLSGSWDVAAGGGDAGGRLYMTCLCVMTLEVYYRHLPIYRREGLKVEF